MESLTLPKKEEDHRIPEELRKTYPNVKLVRENSMFAVFEATSDNQQTKKRVLIKTVNSDSSLYRMNSATINHMLNQEITRIEFYVKYRHVAKILQKGDKKKGKKPWYTMEYQKSLSQLLKEKHSDLERMIGLLIHNVASAMSYAYNVERVVLLGLTPEHILYDREADIFKISDWETAFVVQEKRSLDAAYKDPLMFSIEQVAILRSSRLYLAPEIEALLDKKPIGNLQTLQFGAAFSLGLIALEVLSSKYGGWDPLNWKTLSVEDFSKETNAFLEGIKLPLRLRALIQNLLKIHPESRPSFKKIIETLGRLEDLKSDLLEERKSQKLMPQKLQMQAILESRPFYFGENEADRALKGYDYIELPRDKSIYRGEILRGSREGCGENLFPDNSYYVGFWKNGLPHGRGRMIDARGQVYEGEWKYGKKWGKGILNFKDPKHFYEGDFVDDYFEGVGFMLLPNGDTYSGEWKNGVFHGKGEYISLENKSKYNGEWVNGTRQGKGILEEEDGSVYEGDFKAGQKNGKGVLLSPDKSSCYDGDFVDDLPEGYGTKVYSDGISYKGDWKNGKRNGNGVFTNREEKYSGNFLNDLYHGSGEYTFRDGTVFKGNWKAGKKQGKGAIYSRDGEILSPGEWKDDEEMFRLKSYNYETNISKEENKTQDTSNPQNISNESNLEYPNLSQETNQIMHNSVSKRIGDGKIDLLSKTSKTKIIEEDEKETRECIYSNGDRFIGQWKDEKWHGFGEWVKANGKSRYKGFYVEGKRYGLGRMEYENGDIYDGTWKDGKKHGHGTYTWSIDNSSYMGTWKNDKREGSGEMKYRNGDIYDGHWKDDFFEGRGVYKWADGRKYKGEFFKGKKHGKGKMIYSADEDEYYDGDWQEDYYHGEGSYYFEGIIHKGLFQNGELVKLKEEEVKLNN